MGYSCVRTWVYYNTCVEFRLQPISIDPFLSPCRFWGKSINYQIWKQATLSSGAISSTYINFFYKAFLEPVFFQSYVSF